MKALGINSGTQSLHRNWNTDPGRVNILDISLTESTLHSLSNINITYASLDFTGFVFLFLHECCALLMNRNKEERTMNCFHVFLVLSRALLSSGESSEDYTEFASSEN